MIMQLSNDAKEVKLAASGRWFEIYRAVEPKLHNALDNAGKHVPCPAGTGKRDGFRFAKGSNYDGHAFSNQADNRYLADGFGVLMWLNGWGFNQAVETVRAHLNGCPSPSYISTPPRKANNDEWTRQKKAHDRTMENAKKTPTDSAIKYFSNRGLLGVENMGFSSLLYHPGVPIFYKGKALEENSSWVTVPAIIGRMSTQGIVKGISVIRITKDGQKATDYMVEQVTRITGEAPSRSQVPTKRFLKAAPHLSGSAVRFGKAGKVLMVGEGIETMLAVAKAFNTSSVAATCTTALLEQVDIPESVEKVLIFADKDSNGKGEEAAAKLAGRIQNDHDFEILVPPVDIPEGRKSVDWLDCQNELIGRIAS